MTPRYTLCVEETLGHRAHGLNLRDALSAAGTPADVVSVAPPGGLAGRLPWALAGSIATARALRGRPRPDALFLHTQTLALLAPLSARGTPYVVSVDATPLQMDAMGRWYDHQQGQAAVEAAKRRWYAAVLRRAAGVVTWSEWALDSIREDYAVEPSRALVAHPGASPAFFEVARCRPRRPGQHPRILFVGGQFHRKGGEHLLAAFAPLRDRAELVLVTEDDVPAAEALEGVDVRRGVRPGSPELLQAFAEADLFCLPTLGDCTPVALGEAMAAGLPVVTTDVGSNPEWVPRSVGVLVPPGDTPALTDALARLVDDEVVRHHLAAGAQAHARSHMDARANAARILHLLDEVAGVATQAVLA